MPGERFLSLADFEAAAQRHLPRALWAYVSGGVEDNAARDGNRAAFREWAFVPRVLVDVGKRSAETTLFGKAYSAPVGIAPMGITAMTAYRGDIVLARAAAAEKVIMIMSGSSLIPLEDVFSSSRESPPWFGAYLPGDPSKIEALVERVARAGFQVLAITVDVPVGANRENNVRAGFSTPLRPGPGLAWDGATHPRWLVGTFLRTLMRHGMPHFENNYAHRGAPVLSSAAVRDFAERGRLTWEHVARVRRQWKGPLILKGILNPDDAVRAKAEGMDGVIVSNHGGRQLDAAIAPLRALPAIVEACGADFPVMLDSGVRRGTDVLKALALGAKYVFAGRPFNYAAALGGEAGARRAIAILKNEISIDMAQLGLTSLAGLKEARLTRVIPGIS